jgi:hypothetical protein
LLVDEFTVSINETVKIPEVFICKMFPLSVVGDRGVIYTVVGELYTDGVEFPNTFCVATYTVYVLFISPSMKKGVGEEVYCARLFEYAKIFPELFVPSPEYV